MKANTPASEVELITMKEACKLFGHSIGRIQQLLTKNRFQRYKRGRRTFIDFNEVIAHYISLSPANRKKIGQRKYPLMNKAGEQTGSNGLMLHVVAETK